MFVTFSSISLLLHKSARVLSPHKPGTVKAAPFFILYVACYIPLLIIPVLKLITTADRSAHRSLAPTVLFQTLPYPLCYFFCLKYPSPPAPQSSSVRLALPPPSRLSIWVMPLSESSLPTPFSQAGFIDSPLCSKRALCIVVIEYLLYYIEILHF